MKKLTVHAQIPAIAGAIKLDGNGETMQVLMDIKRTGNPGALGIMQMTGKRLSLTLEVLGDIERKPEKTTIKPTKSVLYGKKNNGKRQAGQKGKAHK